MAEAEALLPPAEKDHHAPVDPPEIVQEILVTRPVDAARAQDDARPAFLALLAALGVTQLVGWMRKGE